MPWPPTLLAVSLLHCATGADAALAVFAVWLKRPKASRDAVSASTMPVGNHLRREAAPGLGASVLVNPECPLSIGTSDALASISSGVVARCTGATRWPGEC